MFYFDQIQGKKVLKSDFLPNVNHFFTTKEFILKTKEEDLKRKVEENINILQKEFNLSKIIHPSQTHSTNIEIASNEKENYPEVDALILNKKEIGIFLNFADCTPVILFDTKNNIGAIAHAGWRGTAGEISKKTVKFMIENFNTNPKNLTALIGPAICHKCFETGKEVVEELSKTVLVPEKFIEYKNEKYYANLKEINKAHLEDMGVEKIDIAPFCTCCDNDKFYSYRKENKTTNRISAFLTLN